MPEPISKMSDADAEAVKAGYARLKQEIEAFPDHVREIDPPLRSMPAPIKP
jgi:hypothetical protein